jgi:hypothetical protein
MQKIIFILLSFIALEASAVRDCPGDKVLYKPPGAAASDCVCPPGSSFINDLTTAGTKFGICQANPYIPQLVLWLDGADPLATGSPPTTGTPITTWKDKSGNGYDATQSTSGLRPTYVSGPTTGQPTLNHGVMSFIGAGVYYNINYAGFNSTDFSNGATIFGVFVTNAVGGTGSGSGIFEKRLNGTDVNSFALYIAPGTKQYKFEVINSTESVSEGSAVGNWVYTQAAFGPSQTIQLSHSGFTIGGGTSSASLSNTPAGPAYVGCRYGTAAANCFNGYIAELRIYDSIIKSNSALYQTIKTTLQNKWGSNVTGNP